MSAKVEALRNIAWEEIKKSGSSHYKSSGVEPIDLYKSLGILKPFCIASIIKYASRNVNQNINSKDMDKIQHYAEILKALMEGADE